MSLNTEALTTARQILNHLEREDPEGAYDIIEALTLEEARLLQSGFIYIATAIGVAIDKKAEVN